MSGRPLARYLPPAMLENGLVNLAAIVGTIILLIGTIPAVLLLTKPKKNG